MKVDTQQTKAVEIKLKEKEITILENKHLCEGHQADLLTPKLQVELNLLQIKEKMEQALARKKLQDEGILEDEIDLLLPLAP